MEEMKETKETKEKIKVAVMGLPEKNAWTIAEAIANSKDLELVPVSLTGPKTIVENVIVGGVSIRLFSLRRRQSMLIGVSPDVVVDCMNLRIMQHNIDFYDKNKLPFVAGHLAQKSHLNEEMLGIIRSLPKKESAFNAETLLFSISNQKNTRHEPRKRNKQDDGRRYKNKK